MLASFNPMALQDQDFSNFLQGKAKLLCVANELEGLDVFKAKQSKPAFAALGPLEKAFPFVEANGVNCEPRLLRDCADLHCSGSSLTIYTLEYSPESSPILASTLRCLLPVESIANHTKEAFQRGRLDYNSTETRFDERSIQWRCAWITAYPEVILLVE
jgi:hypothetical protein